MGGPVPKAAELLPKPQELQELLAYNPHTGDLRFKVDHGRRKAGDYAGRARKDGTGRNLSIMGEIMLQHRAIWAVHYGEWPSKTIDHINGNQFDNRIFNLREATPRQQQYNKRMRKDNTSGFVGVYWHESWQKWVPRLKINGVQTCLGGYDTPEEAAAVREAKAKEIQGEFYTERGTSR